VFGYPTLSLIAAMAIDDHRLTHVTVCMTGGHGEWFVQDFAAAGNEVRPLQSLTPPAAAQEDRGWPLAGSQALALSKLLDDRRAAWHVLPDASRANLLDHALLTETIAPIYGRGPDARLPA
jgi:tRNA threonylcarbamoyladenosine biosynthesis protein TsaB